jgi:cell division protein FtsX
MQALERPRSLVDGLEIAVSALPAPVEPEREATVTLLPLAREAAEGFDELILEADEHEDAEWIDEDDVLLEPSDVLDVALARAAVEQARELELEIDVVIDEQPLIEIEVVETSLAAAAAQTLVDGERLDLELNRELGGSLRELELVGVPRAHVDPIRVPLWSGLNKLAYGLSRGLRGMGQSPLVQLLAIGTMAVCMLLLGTTTLLLQNAQRVAQDLGVDTPVTLYLEPEIDAEALAELEARLAELPEIAALEYVTPEQALARLHEGLGGGDSLAQVDAEHHAELLAGIDAAMLPATLEIALVPGVEPGFADALAERLASFEGVDEVTAMGPWVQQLEHMLTTLRWLALGVAALVSLACLAIVWSTIRLGVFARRSEIEILRLVGGTTRFVRGPFVVEGVLQGVLGTALALACLWLGFTLIQPFLERGLALVFAAGSLRFFTLVEIVVALGFGAMLGLVGSRAAVARHA